MMSSALLHRNDRNSYEFRGDLYAYFLANRLTITRRMIPRRSSAITAMA